MLLAMENRFAYRPLRTDGRKMANLASRCFDEYKEGLKDVDVVMMLRLQKERMDGGLSQRT